MNLMKSQYNTLLENFLKDCPDWIRDRLLMELDGNNSPTTQELGEAMGRVTMWHLEHVPKRKLKTPNLKFDTPNPSEEQIQASLRAWSRDPFNWEESA